MGHGHSFDTLIATAELLASRKSNIQFVITGGGVQADTVQRIIETRRLQNMRLVGIRCDRETPRDSALGELCPYYPA